VSAAAMIGRLVHTADFERVLATPPCSRSAHFAMHHVADVPSRARTTQDSAEPQELSTDDEQHVNVLVDKCGVAHWLGCVVPKRHARRSVTRNLLKRQVRATMLGHQLRLPPGLWLVRLRAPFAPAQYVSAASPGLRSAAQAELQQLFARVAR
jgi:ribonuclease P protein component